MKLLLKKLRAEALLPTQAYPRSVGWDLYAFCLDFEGKANSISLMSGQTKRISTGIQFGGFHTQADASYQYFAMICSRSGLASNSLFVANAPGIVDPDYRGEIEVLLFNGAPMPHYVRHGDRIAQLVAAPIMRFDLEPTDEILLETARGEKGFGSSGR